MERSQFFEAIIDGMDQVACVATSLGQYLACNQRFTELLGWTEGELRDLHCTDLAPSEEKKYLAFMIEALCAEGPNRHRSYARTMRHKSGGYRLVHWTIWCDSSRHLIFGVGTVDPEERILESAPAPNREALP